jgi:hypothetical protein
MTALAGVRLRRPGICTMVAAEELAVFRDSFSLLYFTITSLMGAVLICHPNHLLSLDVPIDGVILFVAWVVRILILEWDKPQRTRELAEDWSTYAVIEKFSIEHEIGRSRTSKLRRAA